MPEGFAEDRPRVSGCFGSGCVTGNSIRPNFVDSIPSVHTSSISVVRPTDSWWSSMAATMLRRFVQMSGEQPSSCSVAIRHFGFGITMC